LYLKEVMLFLSAIAMIHFYKASYRVSAFFITLNLVLLFSVSQELDKNIIFWRAGLTLAGAAIAVVAGFLLFPAWDKKYLPRYTAEAVYKNWLYFKDTFLTPSNSGIWTSFKRQAEVSNSNAFNSFTRAMQEPGGLRPGYKKYYQIISHNMRLTRELNNIHLDEEANESVKSKVVSLKKLEGSIQHCRERFEEILQLLHHDSDKNLQEEFSKELPSELAALSPAQNIYLERLAVELDNILVNSKSR
ncbi:MAG: FUSC family protein, partial [Chitinophagaceae bacterium]